MANFEVRDVVCDYGVYENGELKLILNSRQIAENIVQLLEEDARLHRELNPIKDYQQYSDKLTMNDMNSINAISGYFRVKGYNGLADALLHIQEKAIRLLDEYELLKNNIAKGMLNDKE